MFGNQTDSLMAANFTPEQMDVINQCLLDLIHRGTLTIIQDQNHNSDPRRYATCTLKTNKGKRALNILGGDFYAGGDAYFQNQIITNGSSGTSIAFRNDAGERVPAGGVMQISGYSKKADGTRYLKITKPTSTTGAATDNSYPRVHAINGNDPIDANAFGVCSTTGYSLALCDGATAFDQGWGAKPGQWSLSTGRSGFQTQGVAEADGRTLVFQSVIVDAMGITGGSTISQGGSGTVTIRTGAEADAGYDVTAYDRLLLTSKNTPATSKTDLYYRNGKWWIGGADKCPT